MNRVFALVVGPAILAALCAPARAQTVPPDCIASFNVKSEKATIDISWTAATGKSAALTCGAAEVLREKLFIQGGDVLEESELTGTPATAQQRALTEFSDLERKIEKLPGDNVPATLFAAGGYLVTKYTLASCLLTAEAAGGTCWTAAITFIGATTRFFQRVYNDQNSKLAKQDLLSELHRIRPALTSMKPGQADQAGARARWIQTQTSLCRAIQRDCL